MRHNGVVTEVLPYEKFVVEVDGSMSIDTKEIHGWC